MDREKAIEELKHKLREYVETQTDKSPNNNDYICPICGSGAGSRGTGGFHVANNGIWNDIKWNCWACGEHGDIFELIGKLEGIEDFNKQVERAAEIFNISIDHTKKKLQKSTPQEDFKPIAKSTAAVEQVAKTDYTAYFLKAHNNLDKTDYPQKRGLSRAILDKFNVGYDPAWKHPKAPTAPETPRLIIPTSNHSYLARDTRENIPNYQSQYKKSKVGNTNIFNLGAIQTSTKPIFIVEGEIDALSIMEAGGEAIGLGSTTKTRDLLNYLMLEQPKKPLILSLDTDQAGERATEELEKGLQQLKILFLKANYLKKMNAKDPNEALQVDKDKLRAAIAATEQEAEQQQQKQQEQESAQKEADIQAYKNLSAGAKLAEFRKNIIDKAYMPKILTGFKRLDNSLGGGLHEGLYIIGAISSLGKTTFILQVVDQLAQAGLDVLIFSLEMGSEELMSKSISRQSSLIAKEKKISPNNAKTARRILEGNYLATFNKTELALIDDSFKAYNEYANNIYIFEGIGNIGADQIRKAVKKHIDNTGKTPIVVIDYIQILAPYELRATDKQNTDKAVMELKRISRDYKTPVIGISSFNRANYSVAVTMEAFKESGAIEYSSDVLIGLQLRGAGDKNFNANEAKKMEPREIELIILKNRNGATGDSIDYKYYPKFNLFIEG